MDIEQTNCVQKKTTGLYAKRAPYAGQAGLLSTKTNHQPN